MVGQLDRSGLRTILRTIHRIPSHRRNRRTITIIITIIIHRTAEEPMAAQYLTPQRLSGWLTTVMPWAATQLPKWIDTQAIGNADVQKALEDMVDYAGSL